jgi:hypothetical protein
MSDFNVRSDNVDVEQVMRQIRSRIREKRGVDYTEEEIRELANVKLEKFLDPRGVRSDLLEQFRRTKAAMPAPPNFAFEDSTLFESHRGIVRFFRRLLNPILKLFFNPNPLIQALHIQSELNTRNARREELDALHYEVMHNLVLELTRVGIEVKNLKMRVESMSSRLDFDERRARALEGVVMYRPGAAAPLQPPAGGGRSERSPGGLGREGGGDRDAAERRSRRRRRRGRRRPGDRGDERLSAEALAKAGHGPAGEAGAGAEAPIQQGFAEAVGSDAGPSEAPAPPPLAAEAPAKAGERPARADVADDREPSSES